MTCGGLFCTLFHSFFGGAPWEHFDKCQRETVAIERLRVPSKDSEPQEGPLQKYLKYSHVGMQFFLSVGVPTALGIWLDRRLHTVVAFTLVGLALGFTAGALSAASHLVLRRLQKVDPKLLPFTSLLGVVASFVLMAAFMVGVAVWRREILLTSTLTALSLYLAYRFVEAFEVSRAQSAGSAPESVAAGRGGEP